MRLCSCTLTMYTQMSTYLFSRKIRVMLDSSSIFRRLKPCFLTLDSSQKRGATFLSIAGPRIFTSPTSPTNCISSRTWGTGRPQVGLYPIFLVIYFISRLQLLTSISEKRFHISFRTFQQRTAAFIYHRFR